MSFKKQGCGSASNGSVSEGCKHCINGSKMVLFVTGRCNTGCFYCPVSAEKKLKDVMFANERKVTEFSEIIEEAESMDATGTGITGGDPVLVLDRTLDMITKLKNHFGQEHHIHLYTSMMNYDAALKLSEAGLNEIRFHPSIPDWTKLDVDVLNKITSIPNLDVGIEVPCIPGYEKELTCLIESAHKAGVNFINLNELEFSESNWDMMEQNGFELKDELSSAILGSNDMAFRIMKRHKKIPIHFCSSTFKDGVQLRNRLIRMAEHVAKPYDVVTEDGTILKGIIYDSDLPSVRSKLMSEYNVPDELIFIDNVRNRIEIASWILEEIGSELPYKCYVVEEYPSADRLEVERIPIR